MLLRQRGSWLARSDVTRGAFWVAPYGLALAASYIF